MVSRSALELIRKLTEAQVAVFVEKGKLKTKCSKENLTPAIISLIKENKKDLVDYLSGDLAEESSSHIPARIKPRGSMIAPLSFSQQRLWLLDQMEGGSAQYNMARVLRFTGRINPHALQKSLQTLVERHEILRSVYIVNEQENGEPTQKVMPAPTISIPIFDISLFNKNEQQENIQRLIERESTETFDLSCDLMLRAQLIKLSQTDHIFLFTLHHIAADGWSIGLIMAELSALYSSFSLNQKLPLEVLPIQYSDYAYWQRQHSSTKESIQEINYWRHQLAGIPQVHNLPLDNPRPKNQSYRGKNYISHIDKALHQSLKEFSQQQGATLFMGLYATFSLLLSRYSHDKDVLIGTPMANREQAELANLIGFFVNTLVLRTDFSKPINFYQHLENCKKTTLDAYEHQQIQFERLLEELKPERSVSHSPLFQVLLVLQPVELSDIPLPEAVVSFAERDARISLYDLSLSVTETAKGLSLEWEYSSDLFDTETIERMAAHFDQLIRCIVKAPNSNVKKIDFMSHEEKSSLLSELDNRDDRPDDFPCVHTLFEQHAAKTPDATAVIFSPDATSESTISGHITEQRLSYAQLNAQANRLAHYLIEQGVDTEDLVGICVERTQNTVIALLAIMKAGAAYVPIDPHYPHTRIDYMVEDSGMSWVITENHLQHFFQNSRIESFTLERLDALAYYPETNPDKNLDQVSSKKLAYVIYTSGSTGNPKGVMIEHSALSNFVRSMGHTPGFSATDRLLAVTSLSFDIHTLEVYLPLVSGATLIIASREQTRDPDALESLLLRHEISVMQATPATWKLLTVNNWQPQHKLRILCGGEALSEALKNRLLTLPQVELWNMYGPTETTVWSAVKKMSPENHVTLGTPIDNTSFYVVDEKLALIPRGVVGELLIGGEGLARGYLHRADLTQDKFVSLALNHKSNPTRVYRTGDAVRYRNDGHLEYISRIDFQVKIRGFRIELGEVEHTIAKCPGVSDSVVVVHSDNNEESSLVAYIVPADLEQSKNVDNSEEIRAFMLQELPEHMVPEIIVSLEKLPLTPNGKVDRQALPAPKINILQRPVMAPKSDLQIQLAELWKDVLGLDSIGLDDDFFALGGNSFKAIKMVNLIRSQLNINVEARDILQFSKLSDLANCITDYGQDKQLLTLMWSPENNSISTDQCISGQLPPPQATIEWVQEDVPNAFVIPSLLSFDDRNFKLETIEISIQVLLSYHDGMRLRIDKQNKKIVSHTIIPYDKNDFSLIEHDFSAYPYQEGVEKMHQIDLELQHSFTLTADDPLVRFAYFKLNHSQPHRLLIIFHHYVTDGMSMLLVAGHFSEIYHTVAKKQPVYLPRKGTSLIEWNERNDRFAQEEAPEAIEFWQAQAKQGEKTKTPLDYPVNHGIRHFTRRRFSKSILETKETSILIAYAQKNLFRMDDIISYAIAKSFSARTGTNSLWVKILNNGRTGVFEDLDVSQLFGLLINHPVVLLDVSPKEDITTAINTIYQCRTAGVDGNIGFMALRDQNRDIKIRNEFRKLSVPQLILLFNFEYESEISLPNGIAFAPEGCAEIDQKNFIIEQFYEFIFNLKVTKEGKLSLTIQFFEDRFSAKTINALSADIIDNLRNVIRQIDALEQDNNKTKILPQKRMKSI